MQAFTKKLLYTSLALSLSLASCNSPEVPVVPDKPVKPDTPDTPEQPVKEVKDVLRYISTDGRAVTPGNPDAFGALILSNEYKDGIGTLSFDDAIIAIGDRAFSDCATLKEVFIDAIGLQTKAGEAIAAIGERAFENCTGLEEITIPASVTRIGDSAFKGCSSLRSITLLSMTPPAVGKEILEGSGCTVLVPADALPAYEGASGWSAYQGRINASLPEPEVIDLGLPSGLKWAVCNLGATSKEDPGLYFAWGETQARDKDFNWFNYVFGTNVNITKYNNSDGMILLEPQDDAATAHLGGKWRTPTYNEIQELLDGCTWEWAEVGHKRGRLGTSKVNGQTIFLPTTGFYGNSELYDSDTSCNLWSSLRQPNADMYAWQLCISDTENVWREMRVSGAPIRPVLGSLQPVTDISIAHTEQDLSVGEGRALSATSLPSTASVTDAVWSSSNESVVMVEKHRGYIFGKSAGTATVTVTAPSGKTAHCSVTVSEPVYPVPDAVDLGLPSGLKWASFNLGASSQQGAGVFFSWGETVPGAYTEASYRFYDSSSSKYTKYVTSERDGTVDGKTLLDPEDDAAAVHLGGGWHTPSAEDFQELIDQCVWTSATREGVNGYEVTSKTNGAKIFLPASGTITHSRGAYSLSDFGRSIVYWSASLDPSYDLSGACIYAGITAPPKTVISNPRTYGMCIRGVTY